MIYKSAFRTLTTCSVLLSICHVLSFGQQSPITALGDSRQEAQKPAAVVPHSQGTSAPVDSSTYKVGPGDILNVDVWHEQEFSGLYTVHSDGKITV